MKNSIVFLLSVAVACHAFGQAVVPGEFTDPSNLRKQVADAEGYQTPEALKYPYVSTYYVTPKVKEGERVKIGFFVTDWDSSKIRFLDDSFRFNVHLEYFAEGGEAKRLEQQNVHSGDGEFSLGTLPPGNYTVGIWATDQKGRESHRVWHEFRVLPADAAAPRAYVATRDDLAKYGIRNDGGIGRTVLVDVGEIDPKANAEAQKAAALAKIDAFIAAHPPKPAATTPCYTVFVPTSGGKVLFRSFERSRIVYDPGYDTNAVEKAAIATAEGLQKLIDDKAAAGFTKLTLLPGIYRVSAFRTISLPDNFTLDLGGATLKENAFTGSHSVIVEMTDVTDAHLVNGVLEGDYYEHDYAHSPNNSEWPMGFMLSGAARYCSVENVKVRNITGYGGGNGIGKGKTGSYSRFAKSIGGKYEAGGLNPKTGELDAGDTARFTSDFADVSRFATNKYLQVSKYLGYQGRATRSWNLTACWYDADRKFLQGETAFQYRNMLIPAGAAWLRISVEAADAQEAAAANLYMINFKVPWNCAVKNCLIERARCVGLAPSAMKNMLFEGNEFTASGESAAKCAFDAEDGWDQMQDVYFTRNWFHDNPCNDSILTCAGHNFILEKNRSNLFFWGRTHSPCVRDNDIGSAVYTCDSRLRSGYGRFENNRYKAKVEIRGPKAHPGWDFVLSNLDFTDPANSFRVEAGPSGRLVGCAFANRDFRLSNASGCTIKNGKSEFLPAGNWFGVTAEDVRLVNLYETNAFTKCVFKNTTFHNFSRGLQTFTDCEFDGCTFTSVSAANVRFVRCTFKGGSLTGGYWAKPATIAYVDCAFDLDAAAYFNIALYTIGKIGFRNCKAESTSGTGTALVNISDLRPQPTDDQVGKLVVTGCSFGPSFKQAVTTAAYRKDASAKKIEISVPGNTFAQEGAEAIPESCVLPNWSVSRQ